MVKSVIELKRKVHTNNKKCTKEWGATEYETSKFSWTLKTLHAQVLLCEKMVNKREYVGNEGWLGSSSRECMGGGVLNRKNPTLHSEDSWSLLPACITGVLSWVSSLQFVDNKLNYSPFLLQVILAAGCQHPITTPPDHTDPRLCDFTTKTGALSCLSFKVL